MKFKCPECSKLFEAEGTRIEYHSPIYGPCAKYVGYCPDCNVESDEYREPNPGKKYQNYEPVSPPGCCCSGGSCDF